MQEPKRTPSARTRLPGKFIWFELISPDIGRAQAFYEQVLGWRTEAFSMGTSTCDMAYAGDTMLAAYVPPGDGAPSHWLSFVSVDDVDAAVKAATRLGGRLLAPPFDVPGVGRVARLVDPQGARVALFRKDTGDGGNGQVPPGHWLWNELHTTAPEKAVAFYAEVVGYTHRALDMGPDGTYYVLSRDGVDYGGVSGMLQEGVPSHWLPYVAVEDADAALARARKAGGKVQAGPMDIPGIGRFGVVEEPTGAVLAVMKPVPMQGQP